MLGLSSVEIDGRHLDAFSIDIPKLTQRISDAKAMSLNEVFDRIFKGSMPRLYEIDNVDQELYFESYLDIYIYISRDIRTPEQVANETAYLNFIRIAAARTATNVNYETLAQEAGVSAPTAKSGCLSLFPVV